MAVFAGGCTFVDAEAVCGDTGEAILDELESLVDKALVQMDGQGDRLRMLQTIGEYANDRLDDAGERADIALRHARRYAELAHEIRDGIEGTDLLGSVERGIAEEGNLQAALDTLLQIAQGGDALACESGLQLCGDLFFYWHIRGKNLTAREYAAAFIDADSGATPTLGRAGALITAGLASWILGQFERADEEWVEAYRIAAELGADRELCVSAFCRALSLLGSDVQAGLRWTAESIERSRAVGFPWAEALALAFDGILHGLAGDADTARARYSDALAIQKRLVTRRVLGCRSAGSRSWLPRRATSRVRSTSTASRLRRSRPAATGWRKRGSSTRWRGRTSGTRRRHSRAGTSSTRCRRTPMSAACAASGSR